MALEHWRYFLALEEDLVRTFRFVEPVPSNFRTHSIEFARLLLSACSEIDVVAKILCQQSSETAKANNIDDYRSCLTVKFPKFPSIVVGLIHFNIQAKPWSDWERSTQPGWWRIHNKIKHARHEHFALANLENAIAAMAGLYALIVYLYRAELFSMRLQPPSSAFRLSTEPTRLMFGKFALPDYPEGEAEQ